MLHRLSDALRRAGAVRSGEGAAAFAELTAPVAGRLRAALALQCVATVLGLVPFLGIWAIADAALDDRATAARVWTWVAVVVAGAVFACAARLAAYGLSHRADLQVADTVRRRIADHLSRVPLGWFTSGAAGRSLDALHNDVGDLHPAVAHGKLDVAASIIAPVAAFGWLLAADWRLALVVALPVATSFGLYVRALSGAEERMRLVPLGLLAVTSTVGALVRDLPTLRVLGGPGTRPEAAAHRAADGLRDGLRIAVAEQEARGSRAGALISPAVTLTLVLGTGTWFVAAGWSRPVDLLPFLLLAVTVSGVQRIAETGASLRVGHAAAGRLRAVLDLPTLPRTDAPREPEGHRVELSDVGYGHEPGSPVLHGIDLVLEPGTVTALVGPSGAGKSTLAALIARFHDPDTGRVRLGGVDLREMAPETLYRRIGFVLQDSVLLRTSLRDNIRLAVPDAPHDRVVAAARAAGVHERIQALPKGYDAVAGEDAVLSGGERQRVAIARALLADPPVLVLDEPTAQVDPEAEAHVQRALSRLAAGRTVLVVAHRLATVTRADHIVVLDRGRIVERGRHPDLLARDGVYRQLWRALEGEAPLDHPADAPTAAVTARAGADSVPRTAVVTSPVPVHGEVPR
ncbi:ATP-binding cassette domain-containing protein [Streptomyces sp. NPDC005955]|uniref:ABC transporter ATP-binding protein n=1 Tax=Streptomyces sp. NPDC005955 TaxID=3364738 RepID=UPI00368A5C57